MSDTVRQAGSAIEMDTECVQCGYNLRGLTREGRCPECGSPVGDSLRGNLLRHADPEWLDRLRFGASLKLWNIALSLIVGIGTGIVVNSLGLPQEFMIPPSLAMGILGLWASFAITTQEPRISLHEDPVTLRKAIRLCAALGFVGSMQQNFGTSGYIGTIMMICGAILSVVGIVAAIGELVYFRRFARRIPDGKLERSTTVILWAVPIAMGLMAVVGILVLLVAGGGGAAPPAGAPGGTAGPGLSTILLGGFGCIGGVAGLVFFLWYIRVLTQYKNAFKQAAAESRASRQGVPPEATDAPRVP